MSAGVGAGAGAAFKREKHDVKFAQLLNRLKKLNSKRLSVVFSDAQKIQILNWIREYFTEFKKIAVTLPLHEQETKLKLAAKCMHSKFPPFELPDPKPEGIKTAWRKLMMETHPDKNNESEFLGKFAASSFQIVGDELSHAENIAMEALEAARTRAEDASKKRPGVSAAAYAGWHRRQARVAYLEEKVAEKAEASLSTAPPVREFSAFEQGKIREERNAYWREKLKEERDLRKDSSKPSDLKLSWMRALQVKIKADQASKFTDSSISVNSKEQTLFDLFKLELEKLFFAYYQCVFKKGESNNLINAWCKIPGLGTLLDQVILRDPKDKDLEDQDLLNNCFACFRLAEALMSSYASKKEEDVLVKSIITDRDRLCIICPLIGTLFEVLGNLARSLLSEEDAEHWREVIQKIDPHSIVSIEVLDKPFSAEKFGRSPVHSSGSDSDFDSDFDSESESKSDSDSDSEVSPPSIYDRAVGFVFSRVMTSSQASAPGAAGLGCGAGSSARPDKHHSVFDLKRSAFGAFKKEWDQFFKTFQVMPSLTKQEKLEFNKLKGAGYLKLAVLNRDSEEPDPSPLEQAQIGYAFFIVMRSHLFSSGFNEKISEERQVPLINAWSRLNSEVCLLPWGAHINKRECRASLYDLERWA